MSYTSAFPIDQMRASLSFLRQHGVYVGTSSWKYPGWLGLLYTKERYLTRGKFSEAKFDRECLKEYASVFSTVCVDAGYYRFPSPKFLATLYDSVQDHPDFQFSFKVADEITARKFPNLSRHGDRAGKINPNFLNPDLFIKGVLDPLQSYRMQVGTLILEFTRFKKIDGLTGQLFLQELDHFFSNLPTTDWRFSVEIRNESLLRDEYIELLNRHHVSHVYNQWTRMPDALDQWNMFHRSQRTSHFTSRLLLKKDRRYDEAVASFSPYLNIKERHENARQLLSEMMDFTLQQRETKTKVFAYVNNRLEGSSLMTIAEVLEEKNWLGVKPPTNLISQRLKQVDLFADPS